MVSFEMNDRKKIGLGLTGFGVFFSLLGIIFLFDKGLIAMGNILFLSGVTLTIGLKSSMQFFMKRSNFKGTVSFGLGFILVIIGWPIIGMIVEAYGFVVLFRKYTNVSEIVRSLLEKIYDFAKSILLNPGYGIWVLLSGGAHCSLT
ncbi:UNVERIFIED_CONTAM: Vesicle transport protein GOT1 [Sesamum latifolium]|uniref:Vesicle transport protein GOT1 n=1 Tax=Sesamum latifolium TaxID=2727402 RepID=A0AAW2Y2B1_9LAMI